MHFERVKERGKKEKKTELKDSDNARSSSSTPTATCPAIVLAIFRVHLYLLLVPRVRDLSFEQQTSLQRAFRVRLFRKIKRLRILPFAVVRPSILCSWKFRIKLHADESGYFAFRCLFTDEISYICQFSAVSLLYLFLNYRFSISFIEYRDIQIYNVSLRNFRII